MESWISEIRQGTPLLQQKDTKMGLIRYLMNDSSPVLVNFPVS